MFRDFECTPRQIIVGVLVVAMILSSGCLSDSEGANSDVIVDERIDGIQSYKVDAEANSTLIIDVQKTDDQIGSVDVNNDDGNERVIRDVTDESKTYEVDVEDSATYNVIIGTGDGGEVDLTISVESR